MKYILNDLDIMGNEHTFMKQRKNGLFLSDKDIEILKRNGINYLEYHNLKELIFAINEVLEDGENSELEELNIKFGEYYYYHYTNK